MRLGEYALRLLETTGRSFAVACSTAAANSLVGTNRHSLHGTAMQSVRVGGEAAKYALVYSVLHYGLSSADAAGWVRSLGSSFAASLVCAVRNGGAFALRSGFAGTGSALVHDLVDRIKRT